MDSARFAARRLQDRDATPSRVLYEVFHAYLMPQLDQIDDAGARRLHDIIAPAFDPEEQAQLRRVVRRVLGSASTGEPSALAG